MNGVVMQIDKLSLIYIYIFIYQSNVWDNILLLLGLPIYSTTPNTCVNLHSRARQECIFFVTELFRISLLSLDDIIDYWWFNYIIAINSRAKREVILQHMVT